MTGREGTGGEGRPKGAGAFHRKEGLIGYKVSRHGVCTSISSFFLPASLLVIGGISDGGSTPLHHAEGGGGLWWSGRAGSQCLALPKPQRSRKSCGFVVAQVDTSLYPNHAQNLPQTPVGGVSSNTSSSSSFRPLNRSASAGFTNACLFQILCPAYNTTNRIKLM